MGFDVYRLSNITLIFLPANTTSIVQPLDQGMLLPSSPPWCSAYQAVEVGAAHASKALTTATIRNCWWKAGILGRTKYQRHRPVRATSQRVQVTAAASDAGGDPEASASNDVVMQDAEVAPDTGFMAKPPATRRLRRI
jgi:hypothetical protein